MIDEKRVLGMLNEMQWVLDTIKKKTPYSWLVELVSELQTNTRALNDAQKNIQHLEDRLAAADNIIRDLLASTPQCCLGLVRICTATDLTEKGERINSRYVNFALLANGEIWQITPPWPLIMFHEKTPLEKAINAPQIQTSEVGCHAPLCLAALIKAAYIGCQESLKAQLPKSSE